MASPSGWVSALCLCVLWSCLLQLATGQQDPYIRKLFQDWKQRENGLAKFQAFLSDKEIDVEETIDLFTSNDKIIENLNEQFLHAVDGANIRDTESGDHVYIFNGDASQPVSDLCIDHISQYIFDIAHYRYYARRMLASFGDLSQITAAQYTWLLKFPGNIWLCKSTERNETSGLPPFDGKSCYLNIPAWNLGWGTCWPSTCTQEEINTVFHQLLAENVGIQETFYVDCQEAKPWTTAEIGFLTTMSLITLLVLCGSVYEVFLQEYVLEKMRCGNKGRDGAVKTAEHTYEMSEAHEKQQIDAAASPEGGRGNNADFTGCGTEKAGKVNGGFEGGHEDPAVSKTSGHSNRQLEEGQQKPQKRRGNIGWAILHATLMSFSAVTNCRKLLSAKKTKNTMAVLNGLRVLSIFWVILGHTVQFQFGRISNPRQAAEEIVDSMAFGAIYSGNVSVDTFFVLSGFLVAYMTLKQIDSDRLKSAGSWAMFYFHRWWRLTPVYMAAMGIFALLFPHFGQGINSDADKNLINEMCRKSWWTHPLYINNLYPWPSVLLESCMPWAWYLACDMQFFIISPILIVLLYKNKKAGMALITTMILISLGSMFGVTWYYGYPMNPQEPYHDRQPDPPNADVSYAMPYTRIHTYLVGIIMGYIMFRLNGRKLRIRKIFIFLGWVLALGTLFAVVYGIWSFNSRYVPQIEMVMYQTFYRIAWAAGICWIIFASLQGYGGPVGVFLELKFWVPMARLSYCVYLVHPMIIYGKIFSDQVFAHVTPVNLAYVYVGNIVFSFVAALILSLLVEGPTVGLEKVMFGKFKRA